MSGLELKPNYLVEKSRVLNLLRAKREWKLPEWRLFIAYLSKINAGGETKNRVVRFSLEEFKEIYNIKVFKPSTAEKKLDNMLGVVFLEKEYGAKHKDGQEVRTRGYSLFERCNIIKNNSGEWVIDITACENAVPLMFDLQNYFGYRIHNVLRLNSVPQIRLYEILKHHEHNGACVYSLDELRQLLGDSKKAYPEYRDLKRDVLEKYQKILRENTDIEYTFNPIKKGRGGKVVAVEFFIKSNKNFVDQMTFDMYD